MGRVPELIKDFAGSIICLLVGQMKYATVVLANSEFVTTRCSAPINFPLLITCTLISHRISVQFHHAKPYHHEPELRTKPTYIVLSLYVSEKSVQILC